MTFTVHTIQNGFGVKNAAGCLLSEDGHSFLSGNGTGSARVFKTENFAAAVAEWMNTATPDMTKGGKRELRDALAAKHNIPAVSARGLFQ